MMLLLLYNKITRVIIKINNKIIIRQSHITLIECSKDDIMLCLLLNKMMTDDVSRLYLLFTIPIIIINNFINSIS